MLVMVKSGLHTSVLLRQDQGIGGPRVVVLTYYTNQLAPLSHFVQSYLLKFLY